jgi:hypothetical protein
VKAACEWLDPQERWTDRCPEPVLAVTMLLAGGAILALGIGFSSSRQILFFGHLLGPTLRIGLVAAAAIEILVARSLVGQGRTAWIAAVAIMGIRGAGDVAIVRNLTMERIEQAATALGRLSPRDAARLRALEPLHMAGAMTIYILAVVLLSVAITLWAGTRLRDGKAI